MMDRSSFQYGRCADAYAWTDFRIIVFTIASLMISNMMGCGTDAQEAERFRIRGEVLISGTTLETMSGGLEGLSVDTFIGSKAASISHSRVTPDEIRQGYVRDEFIVYIPSLSEKTGHCSTQIEVIKEELRRMDLGFHLVMKNACYGIVKLSGVALGKLPPLVRTIRQRISHHRSEEKIGAAIALNYIMYGQSLPNDPGWDEQMWYGESIDMPNVWELPDGEHPVTVAIIDNGYRDGLTDIDESRVHTGYDFVDDDSTAIGPQSSSGDFHGAFIQSLLLAQKDNQIGIAGLTHPGIAALPVRVLDDQKVGSLSTVVDGIVWSLGGTLSGHPVNAHPADVVNLSVNNSRPGVTTEQTRPPDPEGGRDFFSAVLNDYGDGNDPGDPIFICAAGNQKDDARYYAPGNVQRCLTVSATNRQNRLASSYGNYGNDVDLAAPGGENAFQILGYAANDQPIKQIGTSFSAPIVTAVVARMLAIDETLAPNIIGNSLRVLAEDQGLLCTETGRTCPFGRLNAFAPLYELSVAVQNVPWIKASSYLINFPREVTESVLVLKNIGGSQAEYALFIEGDTESEFDIQYEGDSVLGSTQILLPDEERTYMISLSRQGQELGGAVIAIEGDDIAGVQNILLAYNDRELDFERRVQRIQVQAYTAEQHGLNGIDTLELRPYGLPTFTDERAGYQYELDGLEAGIYYVQAIGDTNGDGLYDGRDAQGGFPDRASLEPISLTLSDREDVSFAIYGGVDLEQFGDIGAACTRDDLCVAASSALCLDRLVFTRDQFTWPGGYCSQECQRDVQCGELGACVALSVVDPIDGSEADGGYCLRRCRQNSDCLRQNYHCYGFDDNSGVCEPKK